MHHLIACKFDTCTKKFKCNKLINCMVKRITYNYLPGSVVTQPNSLIIYGCGLSLFRRFSSESKSLLSLSVASSVHKSQ